MIEFTRGYRTWRPSGTVLLEVKKGDVKSFPHADEKILIAKKVAKRAKVEEPEIDPDEGKDDGEDDKKDSGK